MERWVRTGSGFGAQGAVEWKDPNGNPDVTDWFWLEGRGSGNFAREQVGNGLGTSQRLARMRTFREQKDRKDI